MIRERERHKPLMRGEGAAFSLLLHISTLVSRLDILFFSFITPLLSSLTSSLSSLSLSLEQQQR
jgi:hypothetical protein